MAEYVWGNETPERESERNREGAGRKAERGRAEGTWHPQEKESDGVLKRKREKQTE